MVYERIKTIKGHQYKYKVKSIRIGKDVKQKNVKYLGPVNPIYKAKNVRKSIPRLFVRELKLEETIELKKTLKHSLAFSRDRARIILLSSQKHSVNEISTKLDCDVKKVKFAIKAFNEEGLKALIRKKSTGRPSRFSPEQKAQILQTVLTEPKKLNLHFTTWSLSRLKDYLITNRVVDTICIETLRKIIKSQLVNYKKSRDKQYSNDPKFAEKKLNIDNLKKTRTPEM